VYDSAQVQYALGDMMLHERKAIYDSADIVYATAPTIAFDYLHDSDATEASALALPALGFAIIDEVDQILIDNALNAFILSKQASFWNESTEQRIQQAVAVAQGLVRKQLSILAVLVQAGTNMTPKNINQRKSDMAQLALLQEALDGVVDDARTALDTQVANQTYIELHDFALEHLGMLPSKLYGDVFP
jgi:preprotein translocase subunit SecA